MPLAAAAKFPANAAGAADLLNLKNLIGSPTLATLASGITDADTSATVATGTGALFPADNFTVTIEDEIIFVGSRSSDTLSSLTRGFEGTTPAAHDAAASVDHYITALSHNQLAAEVAAIESWKAWRLHPDRPPASPATLDDEFDAAALDTATRWTWVNQSSATATLLASWLRLYGAAASGEHNRLIVQASPSTTFSFAARISTDLAQADGPRFGIAIRETATGKIIHFGPETESGTVRLYVTYLTNTDTWSSRPLSVLSWTLLPQFLKIAATPTQLTYYSSMDGIFWTQRLQTDLTAFLTAAADQVGFLINSNSSTNPVALTSDWFRQTA